MFLFGCPLWAVRYIRWSFVQTLPPVFPAAVQPPHQTAPLMERLEELVGKDLQKSTTTSLVFWALSMRLLSPHNQVFWFLSVSCLISVGYLLRFFSCWALQSDIIIIYYGGGCYVADPDALWPSGHPGPSSTFKRGFSQFGH